MYDPDVEPAPQHVGPDLTLPKVILPYQPEELFPKPPEVDAFRFLGNLAIGLAVTAWSAAIGLNSTHDMQSVGRFRAIGGCVGGLAWLISATLAIGVAWRREIRGVLALFLDVLLFIGCWTWNLFDY